MVSLLFRGTTCAAFLFLMYSVCLGKVELIVIEDAVVNQTYHNSTNNSVLFVYEFAIPKLYLALKQIKGVRVSVAVKPTKCVDSPVVFFVQQGQKSLDWKLPFVSIYDGPGQTKNVTVKPFSSPFVLANFTTDYALLKVISEDQDCATLVVMDAICPSQDHLDNFLDPGFRQTMTKQAGMILERQRFPNGVAIGLIIHGSEDECTSHPKTNKLLRNFSRMMDEKIVNITFMEINNNFWHVTVYGMIGAFSLFLVVAFLLAALLKCWNPNVSHQKNHENNNNNGNEDGSIQPPNEERFDQSEDGEHDNVSLLESEHSENAGLVFLNEIVESTLEKNQSYDLWKLMLLTFVFLSIPTVILFWSYVGRIQTSGDMDLCYYNYLCAFPTGKIHDFNHFFSNLAYIILGVTFSVITGIKHWKTRPRENYVATGLPGLYGLYYSMGGALVMEGVFSALYHLCPSHDHFQFDAFFMYVMLVYCMMRVYESRRLEIKLSPFSAFGLLAIAAFLNFLAEVGETVKSTILAVFPGAFAFCFQLIFEILHSPVQSPGGIRQSFQAIKRRLLCILNWCGSCGRVDSDTNGQQNYFTASKCHGCLKTINYMLAYAIAWFTMDLAKTTLFLLIILTIATFGFYLFNKVSFSEEQEQAGREKESVFRPGFSIILILTIGLWIASVCFFVQSPIAWEKSPAESRTKNEECYLLIMDSHDIWHVLSALSLFFTFLTLLVVDDDLLNVPRNKILVF